MAEYLLVFIQFFFDILFFAILVRILMSWFVPEGGGGRLRAVLFEITEPILGPFRRIIPRIGMLDISPMVALFALDFVRGVLVQVVISLLNNGV